MSRARRGENGRPEPAGSAAGAPGSPGKRTLTESLPAHAPGPPIGPSTPGKRTLTESLPAAAPSDHPASDAQRAGSATVPARPPISGPAWNLVATPHKAQLPTTEVGAVSPPSTIKLGRLARFGAGNIAGQTALDMSEAAIRSWLQRLKLGARIRTDELVIRFRAGAEPIRFLTGERPDAPTLRAFDRASRMTAIGAAALVLAPAVLAVATETAPALAIAGRVASQRVLLWALTHPAAALAASEALLALGIQIGEGGWEAFWDQLRDPNGRWFILAQVLMDYMHVRSGMSGHGATPADPPACRPSSPVEPEPTPTSRPTPAPSSAHAPIPAAPAPTPAAPEPDVPGARARTAKLGAVVRQIHDAALATSETDHGAYSTGPKPPPRRETARPASTTGAKPPPRREARGSDAHAPAHTENQKPGTADADRRKPTRPPAHDEPAENGPPRVTDEIDNEIPEGHGRGLPECPVARSTLAAEVIEIDHRVEYEITGKTATGKRVDFGSVELKLTSQGDPAEPPTMSLGASAFIGGAEHAAHIYDEVVVGPGGHATGKGPRTSLTRYALTSFGQFYERRFGRPLKAWKGRLAFENKLNFQREYARLTAAGLSHEIARLEAAKRISYGRHRLDAGFTIFHVDTDQPVPVDLGNGFGVKHAPTTIDVLAERP